MFLPTILLFKNSVLSYKYELSDFTDLEILMKKTLPVSQSCCRMDSVITVDERGQTVLPKDLREKLGILKGGKLAVITCSQGDTLCCLALVPADKLNALVKDFLEPVMPGMV